MKRLEIANAYVKQYEEIVSRQYRPTYHMVPPIGWMNDPNGFCQFKGEYHLFYQYHPFSSQWGPMHWGHYKSKDLLQWELCPVALAPDQPYDRSGCFSGSALEVNDELVLLYTSHLNLQSGTYQQQCIAKSRDGIHFEKSALNPVIKTDQLPGCAVLADFRDPKLWFEKGTYYSVIASRNVDRSGQILLYKSYNLLEWQYVSVLCQSGNEIGEMWECPDLFELNEQHVLILSPMFMPKQGHQFHNLHSSIYMVGTCNIESGHFNTSYYHEIDYGLDFYAPQTMLDHKGRRIMVAWMQTWERSMPTHELGQGWAGMMTLPRELTIKNGQLYQMPIDEVKQYRANEVRYEHIKCFNQLELHDVRGQCIELDFEIDMLNAELFGIKVLKDEEEYNCIEYNVQKKHLTFDRSLGGCKIRGSEKYDINRREVPIDLENNRLQLRIFLDRVAVEIFIQNGQHTMASSVYPIKNGNGIEFYSQGVVEILQLKKWDIQRSNDSTT